MRLTPEVLCEKHGNYLCELRVRWELGRQLLDKRQGHNGQDTNSYPCNNDGIICR
jgi:hypothetical protein